MMANWERITITANPEQNTMDMHEKYQSMTDIEKEAFSLGRESVLNDFDSVCKADAFVGFTAEEWQAVKKFFEFNSLITGRKV